MGDVVAKVVCEFQRVLPCGHSGALNASAIRMRSATGGWV